MEKPKELDKMDLIDWSGVFGWHSSWPLTANVCVFAFPVLAADAIVAVRV